MVYPGLCQSFLQARQSHSSLWLSNVSLFLPQVMLHRLTFYGNTSSPMGTLKNKENIRYNSMLYLIAERLSLRIFCKNEKELRILCLPSLDAVNSFPRIHPPKLPYTILVE